MITSPQPYACLPIMPDHRHLDAFIKDTIDEAVSKRPLADADRRALDDLVLLARAFVRLDEQQRASILKLVRERAEQALPGEKHVFFVD